MNGLHCWPTKRLPRPTRLGAALCAGLVLAALVLALGAAGARADDVGLPATVTPAPAWTATPEHVSTPGPERYAPASRGGRDPVERWRPLVERYDWPVETALAVIRCESRGDPGVWNAEGSGAHGLFQLLSWEHKAYELYGVWSVADPEVNVGVAYWIWRASGRTFGASMGWRASAGCWG